jgi:hypothetical protein
MTALTKNWKAAKIKKYMAALASLALSLLRGEDRNKFLVTDNSKNILPNVEEIATVVIKLFWEKVC